MGRFIGLTKRDEMGETFEISVTLLGNGRAYRGKIECEGVSGKEGRLRWKDGWMGG